MCFVDCSCTDSYPFYSDIYIYNMPNPTVKNKLVVNETFVTIWQLHTGSWLTFQLILCQGSTCSTAQGAQITTTHCFTHGAAAAARACLNIPVYKNLGFSKSMVIHHCSLPLKSSQEGSRMEMTPLCYTVWLLLEWNTWTCTSMPNFTLQNKVISCYIYIWNNSALPIRHCHPF